MKNRSKALLVSAIWATVYMISEICLVFYSIGWILSIEDGDWATIVPAFIILLVGPSTIPMTLGAVFSWIGFFGKKLWAVRVAIIFYSVCIVWFVWFIVFLAPLAAGWLFSLAVIVVISPILILGFIGYAKQKKIQTQG